MKVELIGGPHDGLIIDIPPCVSMQCACMHAGLYVARPTNVTSEEVQRFVWQSA